MPLCLALLICCHIALYAQGGTKRYVEVHLYGGDTRDGAPRAKWYRNVGFSDVWLYPVRGAFPQDTRLDDQRSVADVQQRGTLAEY